jgi:methenyltetrahydrofolate cyclohydrolase
MITERPLNTFLTDLASGSPTPGGGSAAAVMGAMGAALVSMVCNVTLGRKGQEAVEPEITAVCAESETLRQRLTAMVAADVAAFDGLMAAYRLPKLTEADKARRAEAIEIKLRKATETPLECARACAEVIAAAKRVAACGYLGVISDAGVAVLAAHAALRSAALNVYINVPSLKDRTFASVATAEIEKLLDHGAVETEAVFALVRDKLGKP